MNFSQNLRRKNKAKTKSSPLKLTIGLAFVILGIGLILFINNDPSAVVSSTSFKDEPVSVKLDSAVEVREEKLPQRILIPSSNIDVDIKEAKVINGYWEVFNDSAGWGKGSGIPGENGNQVIFAHAREGLFLPLRSIKVGDRIYILTASTWHFYEVKEVKEVYPSQVEVIAPTHDQTLTLYTCSGFADTKRLIVIAKSI